MMRTVAEVKAFIASDAALAQLQEHVSGLNSDDPSHDISHALRVALWTQRLGADDVDPRQAVVAALCHDMINVPKDSPQRGEASELCSAAARKLLPSLGFDDAAIANISDAIRDHSFSRGAVPSSSLGRALQDADRLEALGAIGIMRTISTGARIGTKHFDPDDPWAASRNLDDRAYSIDHFAKKLLCLANMMCTPAGRVEAERRTRILQLFLDALAEELATPRLAGAPVASTDHRGPT